MQALDIFRKDYLMVPIHDHLHWSLLLVCFPGVPADSDAERTPCFLHLDSLSGAVPAHHPSCTDQKANIAA